MWFHAFKRDNRSSLAAVLLRGPAPWPNPDTRTSRNEAWLGITPSRVYAYLGRTSESFGQAALTLRQTSMAGGDCSPFDTGGLVAHIQPLCGDQAACRTFLAAFTFSIGELPGCLDAYPGDAGTARYIRGEPPSPGGPHEVWTDRLVGEHHGVWVHPDNQWPAWTWELRSPVDLPGGEAVDAWTCRPDDFESVKEQLYAAAEADEALIDAASHLLASYRPGGTAVFEASLAELQGCAA